MQRTAKLFFVLLFLTTMNFLWAGERTTPVDIFLMIDKSLSMEDPGKFDSLQKWVLNELIGQMIIPGDWITVYQFYEKPEHLLTTTIKDETTIRQVYDIVKAIRPDGQFTDIGRALDTVQAILDERGSNGRFKVLLLLSDLIQDAPWTSKYRGKQNSFKSPYLVEARTIKHDNWYEITLDMDIQDAVVQRTQSLYSDIIANDGLPRTDAKQDEALVQGETKVVTKTNGAASELGGAKASDTASSVPSDMTSEKRNGFSGTSAGETPASQTGFAPASVDTHTETSEAAGTTGSGTNPVGNTAIGANIGGANAETAAGTNSVETNNAGTEAAEAQQAELEKYLEENGLGSTASSETEGVAVIDPITGEIVESSVPTSTENTDNENSEYNGEMQGGSAENYLLSQRENADTEMKEPQTMPRESFFAKNWVPFVVGIAGLAGLVVLILIAVHAVNESKRKKEAQKEKIKLV